MIVRPITPPKVAPHVLNVKKFAATTYVPIGISNDHATIYGASSTTLAYSINDGTSWTALSYMFAGHVLGCQETDDGETIVIAQNGSAAPGYVYKSSGWATNKTTATWTLVLTSEANAFFRNNFGFNASSFGTDARVTGSGKYGLIGEYGGQTNGTVGTAAARSAYFTSNYGTSWAKVYDLDVQWPGVYPDHILCCAYDPWFDRLIVCHQVLTPDTAQVNTLTYIDYSDDHGQTWQTIPLPSWVTPASSGLATFISQNTNILILEDCYLLGSDHAGPGVVRIPRLGYRKLGNPYAIANIATHTGNNIISWGLYRRRGAINAPILYSFVSESSIIAPSIHVSYDGVEFVEAWRDDMLKNYAQDGTGGPKAYVNAMFGPTRLGNIIGDIGAAANEASSGAEFIFVAELIRGQIGDFPLYLTVTGDGSTTAFTFPHSLGKVPSRYFVVPQTYVAVNTTAPTVTVDATNIILTFASAPASSAKLGFAARYA